MPKSEAAKALAAKQKAEAQAIKERKKNSTDPRDWSTLRQIKETYKMTAAADKQIVPLTVAGIAIPVVLLTVVGVLLMVLAHWSWVSLVMMVLLGVVVGLYIALQLLQTRAKKASFAKYKGQAGSAELALQMLNSGRKKLWQYTPAVAFTKQQDVIHRVVGPAGLILVGEGEPGRVKNLLAQQVKRHEHVAYGVTCQTVVVGEREGQVPLEQLAKHLQKLPKTWDETKVDEVARRLTALDNTRQRMPLPKGPLPTTMKGNRSAMRGR